jgi:hypothetical protein
MTGGFVAAAALAGWLGAALLDDEPAGNDPQAASTARSRRLLTITSKRREYILLISFKIILIYSLFLNRKVLK